MSESRYELRQMIRQEFFGHLLVEKVTNRLLGGIGNNAHRAWVFPFNTPRGLGTVQEHAFDHPFHNALFVGQGNVLFEDRVTNFWAPAPDWRHAGNPVFERIGHLRYSKPDRIEPTQRGVRVSYDTIWNDEDGRPVLDERRTYELFEAQEGDSGGATLCDITTRKTAAYGPLVFEATKFGSIGARVQPQLLPPMGGQIVAGDGEETHRGLADEVATGKPCDFVAYEAEPVGLHRFGLCLMVMDNSASADRRGPWFLRDYGMAMFSATPPGGEPIRLAPGETWTATLRAAAYDGPIDAGRAKAWRGARFA